MVEHQCLRIHPWTRAPASCKFGLESRWHAQVADYDAGARVGFAEMRISGWLTWFGRRMVQVYETEDDSLLLTVSRGMLGTWEVLDGDEQYIGSISNNVLLDGLHHFLANFRASSPPSSGQFLSANGIELAALEVDHDPHGFNLRYSNVLEGTPFARMVVLAAALIHSRPN